VIDAIEQFCELRRKKQKQCELKVIYEEDSNGHTEGIKRKRAVRYEDLDKTFEFDVTFIAYIEDNEEESIAMKFQLVKGNILKLYDYISRIKEILA
jgi:hypothetical protein